MLQSHLNPANTSIHTVQDYVSDIEVNFTLLDKDGLSVDEIVNSHRLVTIQ